MSVPDFFNLACMYFTSFITCSYTLCELRHEVYCTFTTVLLCLLFNFTPMCVLKVYIFMLCTYVTGFETSRLPCTQQQDILFTIKWQTYTLTNNLGMYWCWKLPGLLLLWLVSVTCQTFTSARVAFKWLHIPLKSRQPAVIHYMIGW